MDQKKFCGNGSCKSRLVKLKVCKKSDELVAGIRNLGGTICFGLSKVRYTYLRGSDFPFGSAQKGGVPK